MSNSSHWGVRFHRRSNQFNKPADNMVPWWIYHGFPERELVETNDMDERYWSRQDMFLFRRRSNVHVSNSIYDLTKPEKLRYAVYGMKMVGVKP